MSERQLVCEYAPWEEFSPRGYLHEYYDKVGPENEALLRFLHEAYNIIGPQNSMLEVGGGPTIYQLISASQKIKRITFSDYLPGNLEEVRLWQQDHSEAYDWSEFFTYVQQLTENGQPISALEEMTRRAIDQTLLYDVKAADSENALEEDQFDVVSSCFCLDSITPDEKVLRTITRRVVDRVKQNKYLVLMALSEAQYYKVGDKTFPAVSLNEVFLERLLSEMKMKILKQGKVEHQAEQGYNGLLMCLAQKS